LLSKFKNKLITITASAEGQRLKFLIEEQIFAIKLVKYTVAAA